MIKFLQIFNFPVNFQIDHVKGKIYKDYFLKGYNSDWL